MASLDDIATIGNSLNKNISELILQLENIVTAINGGLPRSYGTFTLTAAASITVANTSVTANSLITITPTNASAATLMSGAKSLYLSARTVGTSFAFSTADGNNAAGTETFQYTIWNPS